MAHFKNNSYSSNEYLGAITYNDASKSINRFATIPMVSYSQCDQTM